MSRLISIYYLLAFMLIRINAEDVNIEIGADNDNNSVNDAILNLKQTISEAVIAEQDGVLSAKEIEKFQFKAMKALGELTELVDDPENVYLFLKSKGIYSVIMSNYLKHDELITPLLILTKTLFTTAPITTALMMPTKFVDYLLDIFDNNPYIPLKVHTLDILAIWLPGNPKVQARVMKLKGLEPFYKQIEKFDPSVVRTLLTLFNNILKEHLTARGEINQRSPADLQKLKIYKQIGLLERVETSTVCDGLLEIFENLWSKSLSDEDMSVFEITKSVKPLCILNFTDRSRAIQLFQDLKKHVGDLKETGDGKIVTMDTLLEFEEVLEDYVEKLKLKGKDEF